MEPFLYEPLEQNSHKRRNASKLASTINGEIQEAGNEDLNGYLDELVTSLITNKKR